VSAPIQQPRSAGHAKLEIKKHHVRKRVGLCIHQYITDHIVAAIEAGAGKAELPGHGPGVAASMPVNVSSDKL